MNKLSSRFGWGMHAVLLGALVLLLAAPAAYAANPVLVDAKVVGTPAFSGLVRGEVSIKVNDGSRVRSVTWTQLAGATARLTPLKDNAVRVRLASEAGYRQALVHVLKDIEVENPVFQSGLQDRWQVVALNPHAIEEGGLVVLEVAVLTTTGIYKDTVGVELTLPYPVSTGLNNVSINQRVLFYGKTQASYNWTLASKPFASDAILRDAATQIPWFVPDAAGTYS